MPNRLSVGSSPNYYLGAGYKLKLIKGTGKMVSFIVGACYETKVAKSGPRKPDYIRYK